MRPALAHRHRHRPLALGPLLVLSALPAACAAPHATARPTSATAVTPSAPRLVDAGDMGPAGPARPRGVPQRARVDAERDSVIQINSARGPTR